ncbi:MAG: metallophosphatase family protein [Desulfurococcales archaeon]|nr:metallophosphatase family protein [Desulfurococcales archaeon]
MARILVVSDIHGNIYSLNTVLEHARGWDELVVLGDLVDYGPHPGEVIDILRGYDAKIVRGNHDHAVAFGVDCRCGEETHWLSVWFRENVTLKLLSEDQRKYLASLPLKLNLEIDGLNIHMMHAAPSNSLYAYLYPWLDNSQVCKLLKSHSPLRLSGDKGSRCPQGLYLVGHTHHQFYRVVEGAIVANPGSVGQPRDGDPRAGYMIIDTTREAIELYRVKYDVGRTVEAIMNLGVPEPYMSALKYMLQRGRIPPRQKPP